MGFCLVAGGDDGGGVSGGWDDGDGFSEEGGVFGLLDGREVCVEVEEEPAEGKWAGHQSSYVYVVVVYQIAAVSFGRRAWFLGLSDGCGTWGVEVA